MCKAATCKGTGVKMFSKSRILALMGLLLSGVLETQARALLREESTLGNRGRKLLQAPPPLDCSGYPGPPRRWLEAQSWWTPAPGDVFPSTSSRMSIAACIPTETPITGSFDLDIVLSLFNCGGTDRYVDSFSVSIGYTDIVRQEGVAFKCCDTFCQEVWQVTVDTSLLPGNGNTSLQLQAVLGIPAKHKIPDNEWSAVRLEVPVEVQLDGVNNTAWDDEASTDIAVYGWAHDPWQVVTLDLDYLPPVAPLTAPTFTLPFTIERDSYDYPAAGLINNITSLNVAIDAALNTTQILPNSDGAPNVMRYKRFSLKSIVETPIIDITTQTPGLHTLYIRGDCYIPSNALPSYNNTKATDAQKQGGTNSVALLFTYTVDPSATFVSGK